MPYFIFKQFPDRKLEYIDVFDDYRPARDFAREQRKAMPEDADYIVKMCHANNEAQAQALLHQEREPRPMGEDA
ncbi:MAG: hypothetical protein ACPGU7_06690 [Gammaproteobacteria bacterium]